MTTQHLLESETPHKFTSSEYDLVLLPSLDSSLALRRRLYGLKRSQLLYPLTNLLWSLLPGLVLTSLTLISIWRLASPNENGDSVWGTPLVWALSLMLTTSILVLVLVLWESASSGFSSWHRETSGQLIQWIAVYSCLISTIRKSYEQGSFLSK